MEDYSDIPERLALLENERLTNELHFSRLVDLNRVRARKSEALNSIYKAREDLKIAEEDIERIEKKYACLFEPRESQ